MRDYNETHDDPVRFLGSDLVQLRQLSFDEVTSYVREVAPHRLDELNGYLEPLRLREDRFAQFDWYFGLSDEDQTQLIGSARAASNLVAGLPAAGDPIDRAYAEQHARAILGWYENYAVEVGFRAARERFIADSIEWWRAISGHSIAYWAANAHTSSAETISVTSPEEAQTGTFAGGHLEQQLGEQYVSIGTWFGQGAISSDYTAPAAHGIDPPTPELLEATLIEASQPNYLLPVPTDAPPEVTAWLVGPSTMRMMLPSYIEGEDASDYTMTVPSLRVAFDALVFIEETTASQLVLG
jgi:erythromycin esterase